MPSATLQVVPQVGGDIMAPRVSDAAVPSSSPGAFVGWLNLGPPNVAEGGWMGRFELPIPNGATITGVRFSFFAPSFSLVDGELVTRMRAGVLEPDGIWNLNGGQFRSPGYASKTALPWPERDFTTVRLERWFGLSPSFDLATFLPAAFESTFTWGEGVTSTNAVSGLVSKVQSYLDTYGSLLRGGSLSGTDLPIAFAWYRAFLNSTEINNVFALSTALEVEAKRPTLYVEWTEGAVSSSITARADVRPALRCKTRLGGSR